MPSSRPVATDLLAVVREYLERDLAPLVPEYHRFQLRIVDRLLATVSRETQLREGANADEVARLEALLGHAPDAANVRSAGGEVDGDSARIDALNRELACAIRSETLRHDDPRLRAHLRDTLEASLRINNPKWLA